MANIEIGCPGMGFTGSFDVGTGLYAGTAAKKEIPMFYAAFICLGLAILGMVATMLAAWAGFGLIAGALFVMSKLSWLAGILLLIVAIMIYAVKQLRRRHV